MSNVRAVTLRTAAITFGALTIEIDETPAVSQPLAPFGTGSTKVVPTTDVKIKEGDNPIRVMSKAATVGDVAAALAALGAKPRDLVAILRALKASGALRAGSVKASKWTADDDQCPVMSRTACIIGRGPQQYTCPFGRSRIGQRSRQRSGSPSS